MQSVQWGICTDVVQNPTEHWQVVQFVQSVQSMQSMEWRIRRRDRRDRRDRREAFDVCGCIEPMPSLQTMDEAHTRGTHEATARGPA